MILALLAAASTQTADVRGPVTAEAPATAVVRIVRAAEIRLDRFEAPEGSVKRVIKLRAPDGTVRTASLIEFY